MSLNILIEGLAICHFDDKAWKLFFPNVDNHHFSIILEREKQGEEKEILGTYQIPRGNKVTLETSSGGDGEMEPDLLGGTVDLSELHGEPIHLKNDKKQYAAFLELQGVSLETDRTPASTNTTYAVWKVFTEGGVEKKVRQSDRTIRDSVSAALQTDPGDTTTLTIEGDFGFTVSFMHEANTGYQITFRNLCDETRINQKADFKFYYNIIDKTKFADNCEFEFIAADAKRGGKTRCDIVRTTQLEIPDDIKF